MSSLHNGVIVVDKPTGMTSARVVGKVKRLLGVKKIGHTGTLDPMATGVLPLCIGEGTKIAGYLLAEDKTYEGEFLLGIRTNTLDREGEVTEEKRNQASIVTASEVEKAMLVLSGEILQVPPMFSALKHKGRRLHSLAREGKEVDRPPRQIHVYKFSLLSFSDCRGRFIVHASKGTYVRSLVDDLGQVLGCGAHLTALRRTQSGRFRIEDAVSLEDLSKKIVDLKITDPSQAISHMKQIRVPEKYTFDIANGKKLSWQLLSDIEYPSEPVAILTSNGESLLAIVDIEEEMLRYRRVFNYGLTRATESSNVPAEIV